MSTINLEFGLNILEVTMDSVELVKKICKERKIPISRLEMDCGFSNGYIRKLKEGKFPSDRIQIIANYLDLSVDYLMTGKEVEFTVEMGETDLALSNMNKRMKEYALKMAALSNENQELIMQMIDKLQDKKGE